MKMFDPERPSISPQQKALLHEGSAIPRFTISFMGSDTIQISVLVRDYSDTKNRSYSFRNLFTPVNTVEKIIREYIEDPELTLATYFNWIATPVGSQPKPKITLPPADTSDTFDLL